MPTIDELAPALAAADDDMVPVSQGGAARRVSRAQLLAGMQPSLAVPSGTLMGRTGPDVGAPEAVTVAAPLMLNRGVLSGPAAYAIGGLPPGVAPGVTDGVGISQGGRDVAVPYAALMAGLGGLAGVDLTHHLVQGRPLADWMADAMPVEAFGAVGDGVTDDAAAFDRAVASGRPVRLGARTYVVNGQWTVTRAATLLGVAGRSVMRRLAVAGGAWISVQGPAFAASGVVFDAGGLGGDTWGVLVTPACLETRFENCVFTGATGGQLGHGLCVQARGAEGRHAVHGCVAHHNQGHGVWVQAATGAVIEGCEAHDNGAYGLCLDYNDATFGAVARQGRVLGNRAWANSRGISVGNYNELNTEPPRWGLLHPDAIDVLVAGNVCDGNSAYGIAVSGQGLLVVGNRVSAGAGASGVLVNAGHVRVSGNLVSGPGDFGIDAGGCDTCDVSDNTVQGFNVGINPGGSRGMRVRGNQVSDNVWGITVYNVETDGRGQNFGIATDGLTIEGNRIVLRDGTGGGVFLMDAPQGVAVLHNQFFGGPGTSASQALWAHTDAVLLGGNRWNNQARMICNPIAVAAGPQVQVPDALDEAWLTSAPQGVSSIVGQHQAAMAGQVAYVRVTSGGSGYSRASLRISGSGSGASGTVHVRDGVVIGVAMASGGSGYGGAATAVIEGDGAGALAVAGVGLPVLEGRRLRLHCNGAVRFKRVGSLPFQDNWTGADITVPAASTVEWVGAWGGWQAASFPLGDYVTPAGDGSVVLRSVAGDVTLRPSGSGRVRIASDAEPFGVSSMVGRGSPEGVVSAVPGSDYRNLDGGAGATLWVKRGGSAAAGWAAVG